MEYLDEVYGIEQITEPVLLDLLDSTAVRRLGSVLQHGITGLLGITEPITRLEHSIGAMILCRRLGASLEEQIATLLHDISHTAFSHVIDYVFDNHDGQSYHDDQKEAYMAQTDLPALLASHGYDWHIFIDETAYPILEQPTPHLCADRIDYFLRDSIPLRVASQAEVFAVLPHLKLCKGRIAVDSIDMAQWLAHRFIEADDASWSNFREVGLYELTAQAIKRGLDLNAIQETDLWGTDTHLWRKLQQTPDTITQILLQAISPKTKFRRDPQHATFWVSTKIRTIDPDVITEQGLVPLSELDLDFAAYRQAYLKRKQGKWPMKVEL